VEVVERSGHGWLIFRVGEREWRKERGFYLRSDEVDYGNRLYLC
jgi:hypothetical protein